MCDTHGVNTRQQTTSLMKKAVTINDICLNGGRGVAGVNLPSDKLEALQELNIKQFKNWFDYRCLLSLLPPAPSFRSHLTCSACVSYHHGNRHTREKWRRKKWERQKQSESFANFFFLFFFLQPLVIIWPAHQRLKGATFCIATCEPITDATDP